MARNREELIKQKNAEIVALRTETKLWRKAHREMLDERDVALARAEAAEQILRQIETLTTDGDRLMIEKTGETSYEVTVHRWDTHAHHGGDTLADAMTRAFATREIRCNDIG